VTAVLADSKYSNDRRRIEAMYVASLGRRPTNVELNQLSRSVQSSSPLWAYQDLYWALLNSNEFLVNH
jgi:hypothetical protein